MNYVTLTATVINDPAEVELRNNSYTSLDIEIAPPKYGNYSPTQLEFKVWGNAQNQIISKTETEKKLLITKGSKILIENAELFFTYNKETKIQGKELKGSRGTNIQLVPQAFPDMNTIILSGLCMNDLGEKDFISTKSGFMSVKQRLAVFNKLPEPNFYTFKANHNGNNKYGINYAQLVFDHLNKKNMWATIHGYIVTESWTDKTTQEQRESTLIILSERGALTRNGTLKDFSQRNFNEPKRKTFQSVSKDDTSTSPDPEWSIAPQPATTQSAEKPF
mgnify:FL=1|tara:strand:+ start:3896 stop:4726 length:831 start_codon:yes stop_codon:yes gene_type:complete